MEWQMELNLEKYEMLHYGKLNQARAYTVNAKALEGVVEQRDLG